MASTCLGLKAQSFIQYQGRMVSEIPDKMARIVLRADSINATSLGYQILLDSTAKAATLFKNGSLPFAVSSPNDSLARVSFYDTFAIKMPVNADGIKNTKKVLHKTTDSIDIPAGVYDYIILNPQSNGYLYAARGNFFYADNMMFEAGYTYYYNFITKNMGNLEFIPPFEAAVSQIILPPSGHALTETETVGIKIINSGSQSLENFSVGFKVDMQTPVVEVFEGILLPGDTVEYTFREKVDFSAVGSFKVKAWVSLPMDVNVKNDTLTNNLLKHLAIRELPFQETFSHADSLKRWTIYDAAKQNGNWSINAYAEGALGSKGYVQTYSSSKAADLYLISDPLQLDSGFNHLIYYFVGGNMTNPENMEVLYGSSSRVEDMQVLGEVTARNKPNAPPFITVWGQSVHNIELARSQVIYIAFRLKTSPRTNGFQLDEIRINKGKYDLIPDIALAEVLLPDNACGLGKERVGLRVRNEGKLPMNGFSLSYQMDIGGEWLSESFTDTIVANDVKDIYFMDSFDFSTENKTYMLRFVGMCEGQDNAANDTTEASLVHFAPIDALPYLADFSDMDGLGVKEWHGKQDGAWEINMEEGTYKAKEDSIALVSRCINLQTGIYRFNLDFIAGRISYGGVVEKDDFRILYGPVGTGLENWDSIAVCKDQITNTKVMRFDTLFTVNEAGIYSFAFISDKLKEFAIAGVSIEQAYENDLRLNTIISPTLAKMTPHEQMKGKQIFNGQMENRGKNIGMGVQMNIKRKDTVLFSSIKSDSLYPKGRITLNAEGYIPNMRAYEDVNLTVDLVSDAIDGFRNDNTLAYTFMVSDTVFAQENVQKLQYIFEDDIRNELKGNIYRVIQSDTLTSITLGLAEISIPNDSIEIGVCKIRRDTVNAMMMGDTIFRHVVKRVEKGGFVTYAIEPKILDSADYYVYVKRITSIGMQLIHDSASNAFCYKMNQSTGKINKYECIGNLVIRANFGRKVEELAPQVDLGVYAISKPEDSGMFSATEKIEVTLVNYSDMDVKNAKVVCLVNGEEQTKEVDFEASASANTTFEFDMSALGVYTIQVFTTMENDLDRSNDTLTKIVKCIEKGDTIRIESQEIFTIQVYPNPTQSILNLQTNGNKMREIHLYSMGGKCLFFKEIDAENYTLPTSFLERGFYMLRIKTDKGVLTKKIIKE